MYMVENDISGKRFMVDKIIVSSKYFVSHLQLNIFHFKRFSDHLQYFFLQNANSELLLH